MRVQEHVVNHSDMSVGPVSYPWRQQQYIGKIEADVLVPELVVEVSLELFANNAMFQLIGGVPATERTWNRIPTESTGRAPLVEHALRVGH